MSLVQYNKIVWDPQLKAKSFNCFLFYVVDCDIFMLIIFREDGHAQGGSIIIKVFSRGEEEGQYLIKFSCL